MSTDTVLTPEEIFHLWDTRIGDPSSKYPIVNADKLNFARAIEQAVLQSPEVKEWREAAERQEHSDHLSQWGL